MKVAIVTGAGSGIGRAAAIALSQVGYTLALVGRTAETLRSTANEIEKAGGRVAPFSADVSDADAVKPLVENILARFGRIDALVNNVGIAPAKTIADMSPAEWDRTLQTNLSSAFYMSHAAWQALARHGGVIVNISSMSARDPFPGLVAYAAAKAGLNMLTLMTAREGEPAGIRAVGIAPGAVDTPMLRGLLGNDRVTPDFAMQPEEVAEVIRDAVRGSLRLASGETIYIHRKPA